MPLRKSRYIFLDITNIEVRARWPCPCPPRQSCRLCQGKKYLEAWLPLELVAYVTAGRNIVVARSNRKLPSRAHAPLAVCTDQGGHK